MRRTSKLRLFFLAGLLLSTVATGTGCRILSFFGDNFTLSIIIPLFGGSGGFLSPLFPSGGGTTVPPIVP